MIILKILLIILLSLLALFALVLLLNVRLKASFSDELSVEVGVLFVRIKILPQKPKKKKPAESKKKQKPDKPEKKGGLGSVFKEKGLSGFLTMLKELIRLSTTHLVYLLSHLGVSRLYIRLSYAGGDAAKTAIGYGKCCSVVYPAASIIASKANCKSYDIQVTPNFDEGAKTEISALLTCKVRIFWILITALKFLAGYIKLKTKGIV